MYTKYFDWKMEGSFRVRQGKELKVKGTFKGGKPHGVFYLWCGKYILSTSTFVNGKVLEWSDWDSNGVVSRNKKGGAHVLEKSEFGGESLVKTYLFSGKECDKKNKRISTQSYISASLQKSFLVVLSEQDVFWTEKHTKTPKQIVVDLSTTMRGDYF